METLLQDDPTVFDVIAQDPGAFLFLLLLIGVFWWGYRRGRRAGRSEVEGEIRYARLHEEMKREEQVEAETRWARLREEMKREQKDRNG